MFESYRSLLHRCVNQAREEERKRIAREVHDQLIQHMLLVRSRLAALSSAPAGPDADSIDQLQDEIGQLLTNTRQICSDLRPPAIQRLGLCGAMRAWLYQFQQQIDFGLHFDVECDERPSIPEDVGIGLFRVLQEALINVQKHAGASWASVKLHIYSDSIIMEISDDGVGFTVPQSLDDLSYRQSFGLIGMRERVELMQGTLSISSGLNQGTYLLVQVPVGRAAFQVAERYVYDESHYSLVDDYSFSAHSRCGS